LASCSMDGICGSLHKHFTIRPIDPRVSANVPTVSFVSVRRTVRVMLLPLIDPS